MQEKVMSLSQAADLIKDGMLLAVGGLREGHHFFLHLYPPVT